MTVLKQTAPTSLLLDKCRSEITQFPPKNNTLFSLKYFICSVVFFSLENRMLFFFSFPTWDPYLSIRVYSSLTFLSTPASQSKCCVLHIIRELIYKSKFTLGVNWCNFLYCKNINSSDNLENHFLWNCI